METNHTFPLLMRFVIIRAVVDANAIVSYKPSEWAFRTACSDTLPHVTSTCSSVRCWMHAAPFIRSISLDQRNQ